MAIKIFGFKDKEKRLNGKEVFFKYSNTEQFTGSYWIDGKKIYEKTINIGALPNNNVKTVSHGINQIDRFIDVAGVASSPSAALPIPNVNPWSLGESIICYPTTGDIIIGSASDKSSYTGYITLRYTKTTD
ncbi:hypothetical protein [Thomasclavelia ramosa]|uniref:hypothetical protein n=1 Tax=Thomasclavelia ramosa TaxID=1547 RepID=UPI0022E58BE6|nr:hypothetical protein [Thomasclavelia ramosa]